MSTEHDVTKQRIFETAAVLFASEGFHNVSEQRISEVVAINNAPMISEYYSSKDDLLKVIFDYYETVRITSIPALDSILRYIGTEHPHMTLQRTIAVYPKETLVMMAAALRIANTLSTSNIQAKGIIDNLLQLAGDYAKPILTEMIDRNLIEPLDIEHFSLLFNSFCFAAAVRHYEDNEIQTENYTAGLCLLFQLVRPTEAFLKELEAQGSGK